MFGVVITGARASPEARYFVVLGIVVLLTWVASNLVHGRIGRSWMAVRDMDIAAEFMGIKLLPTKLLAFAVSSFYCGVAGAMMVFLWYATGAEYNVFDINQSFQILFMIIIGGLGSLTGSFFGAGLIFMLPIVLGKAVPELLSPFGLSVTSATIEHLEIHGRRGIDHLFPDRRAARSGAALADRQAEASRLAISLLVPSDYVPDDGHRNFGQANEDECLKTTV